uniref:MD-2-related lipid-recognition domain-containing protein n=1 Tax=Amblyomma maculatum TaxID=34609 RepID=G3MNP5_AMBMU
MLWLLVVLAFIGSALGTASVQRPKITSCSKSEKFMLSDVSITNAQIGQSMVVNTSINIREPLGSSPTLSVTMRKQSGSKIPCLGSVGSCTYKLCRGTTSEEQELAKPWQNQCPVPAITVQESKETHLTPMSQIIIGKAPTTISFKLKVVDGGATVGCQSFKVEIAAA